MLNVRFSICVNFEESIKELTLAKCRVKIGVVFSDSYFFVHSFRACRSRALENHSRCVHKARVPEPFDSLVKINRKVSEVPGALNYHLLVYGTGDLQHVTFEVQCGISL